MKKYIPLLLCLLLILPVLSCKEPEPNATAHEHIYDIGQVAQEPTHLANGMMRYTCITCGESFTDVIERSGVHTWSFVSVDGESHTQRCECGFVASSDKHIFTYGEVLREPSPEHSGERACHCVLCQYQTTVEVLYTAPEPEEGEEEILMEKLISLTTPDAGSVAYTVLDDCALLTGGYVITREGDGMLGVEMPVNAGALVKDRMYVFSFKGRSPSYRRVTVELLAVDGEVLESYTYALMAQYTEYSFPFRASTHEFSVRVTADNTVGESILGGLHISPSDSETVQNADSGYSMIEDGTWSNIEVDYQSGRVDGTVASRDVTVYKDGYIIALAKGLHIYKQNGTTPTLIWKEEEGLAEARQMELSDDKSTLYIVARSGGVFVYDLTDIEHPVRICHFDSLEMATGLDALGDYLFIADRSFGVSIYDVKNPAEPKIVSMINAGEVQDVTCYDGFVYCGVWAAQKVRIYDARDIDNPTHVYDIPLSGRGDGVTLSGGYLYAATGHHEPSETNREAKGYAVGNGMEIWDVHNPYEPKLMSIVRCDGRAYVGSPDIWRITLADRYAFLSCSYMGVYVYDVSNPSAPLRVAKVNVRADKGETGYKNVVTKEANVVPYDSTAMMYAPLVDCDIANGILYLSGYNDGLFVTTLDCIDDIARREEDTTVYPSGNDFAYFSADDFSSLRNSELFVPGTQVWTVRDYRGHLYVAAGLAGIYVLDYGMNVVAQVKTKDACYDLSIENDIIYTAESVSGVGIYRIDASDPTKITQHSVTFITGAIVQLVLSPGAKFALCHTSNSAVLVDLRDHNNVSIYETYPYSMFYQHQISFSSAQNRYLWCYSTISNQGVMIDFGENGAYDAPVARLWNDCSVGFNTGGICVDGDYFLACSGLRYYLVDPSDESIYSVKFRDAGSYVYRSNTIIGGAPTVIGNYLFVRNRINGSFAVYEWESDDHTKMPELLFEIDTRGSTANPIMIGSRVYIPLGYEGLLAFDLK